MLPTRNGNQEKQGPASRRALLAWASYDWGNNAFATLIQTFIFAAYFTRQVAESEQQGTTLWGLTLGISGVLVAVSAPLLGAIADQAGRHKPWIALFTLLSVTATALLWFIRPTPEFVIPALILLGIGTLGSQIALLFYNALLPQLTTTERFGRWSGWGWSAGYAGGLLCLALAWFLLIREGAWLPLDPESAEPVRATFLLAAGWYLLFSLPLLLFTPDSPSKNKPARQAISDGLGQLRDTLRHIRHYRPVAHFLIARLIYSDGMATLFAMGGVYAAGTFGMEPREVLLFGIALNVTAGLGAASFAWITDRLGSRRTILVSLVGLIVPGTFILLVESTLLFWALGMVLGLFVGPVQSASRALMASLSPETLRREMFGFYALSGKATAFLGPLFVGGLTYLSGSQRVGMGMIIVYFVAGFVLLLLLLAGERKHDLES
ncbi:MFS transporter [Nitrosococcus wardiae]|uniref:MFS transporter n=1 Tax=Nitrosococcus wardiae TaxID=1814290 RepID=A0A4P7BW72_9GAMM|nr:MFS transporter [Nitrosococcus wardiae]QBQ54308.1 MFS transporter [Nitrosococcus wardiae]